MRAGSLASALSLPLRPSFLPLFFPCRPSFTSPFLPSSGVAKVVSEAANAAAGFMSDRRAWQCPSLSHFARPALPFSSLFSLLAPRGVLASDVTGFRRGVLFFLAHPTDERSPQEDRGKTMNRVGAVPGLAEGQLAVTIAVRSSHSPSLPPFPLLLSSPPSFISSHRPSLLPSFLPPVQVFRRNGGVSFRLVTEASLVISPVLHGPTAFRAPKDFSATGEFVTG